MLFKNNVLQDLASSSTALFLANMIIATFVQVAIENTAPALENTDSPDVPGNDSRERVEADAGKLAHSLSPLPRDTSLLYIWGLLTPAKDYAAKSNLSTIWNVYEGHYYPPDSHTDAERQKFYRILACGYIDTCWGIVWPMVSRNSRAHHWVSNFTVQSDPGKRTAQVYNDFTRLGGTDSQNYWGH